MFIEATTDIASRVTSAIRDAARTTGAGFDYLLKTALRESNLDPNAKATTSSATGLFQFIDQTWLATLKQSGPSLGYADYANAIVQTGGRYDVPDPAMREKIMQLRFDPAANAVMAGALTNRNAADITAAIGRKPTEGELYIAHFLGSAGAIRLITQAAQSPDSAAATSFPDAARANRSIFYDKQGTARTAVQVYAKLVSQHDQVQSPVATPAAPFNTALALAPPAPAFPSIPPTTPRAPVSAPPPILANAPAPSKTVPPSQPSTNATNTNPYAGETAPVFHALFRNQRSEPVSPLVSELWGIRSDSTVTAQVKPADPSAVPAPAKRQARPFDFLRLDAPPQAVKPNQS